MWEIIVFVVIGGLARLCVILYNDWKNTGEFSHKSQWERLIPNNGILYRFGLIMQALIVVSSLLIAESIEPDGMFQWIAFVSIYSAPVWFVHGYKWLVSSKFVSINATYIFTLLMGFIYAISYAFMEDEIYSWGKEEQIGLAIYNILGFLLIRPLMNLKSSKDIIKADKVFNLQILKASYWIAAGIIVIIIIIQGFNNITESHGY